MREMPVARIPRNGQDGVSGSARGGVSHNGRGGVARDGRDGVSGGRARREGEHVVGMQYRRLLTATVELVYEHGAQSLTVATVCARAGLSRKTFYDIFTERDDCLLAAFEDAVEQVSRTVEHATVREERWRDRIRAGLTTLLSFLDQEPGLARLLVVEALSSGERTLNARERVLSQIIAIIDEGRTEAKRGLNIPPLTAELLTGAVFSIIHARMLARDPRSLSELSTALTATILEPYLGSATAQRTLAQPTPAVKSTAPRLPTDPFKDLSIRLTYRTARVLTTIAATPGASSKQVAGASGITDDGQISRLLTRLKTHGLIQDNGIGPTKGQPRAWTLTQRGEHVLHATTQG